MANGIRSTSISNDNEKARKMVVMSGGDGGKYQNVMSHIQMTHEILECVRACMYVSESEWTYTIGPVRK